MTLSDPELLLVAAVAGVGVFHTMVPDHWVPITLVARQRGWSVVQTARAALLAGTGHVLSTLLIAVVVWVAGVAAAKQFGGVVDTLASLALIGFGGWIAIASLLDMRKAGGGHGHSHGHSHGHGDGVDGLAEHGVHGPELQRIDTGDGEVELSIYETGMPPHFRLSGGGFERATATTVRPDGSRQVFNFVKRHGFWESTAAIPEPHGFEVTVKLGHGDHEHDYQTVFAEHVHGAHDHGDHSHAHDDRDSPARPGSRTALVLILGSSPMVEGIPAFFAAGRYGVWLIILMSLVFAAATIATYVVLCIISVGSLKRVSLGPLEKYGEVLSGGFIALIGVAFWLWPLL